MIQLIQRKVTKADWLRMVEDAIEAVINSAATQPRDSAEWEALTSEPLYLQKMRNEVLSKDASQRDLISSRLVALSVREFLKIQPEVVEKIGLVSDLYRRHRNDPDW
jgi:hypothetical protein